jgi:acetyl-CoA C-acetyltransferase
MQRQDDLTLAAEPLALMLEAAQAAGRDAGTDFILPRLERVYVPVGRWGYRNPGGLIAAAVGSSAATSISALPGVSQQTILSDAATAIQQGEMSVALVVGGEAGYRLRQAAISGRELADTLSTSPADVVMKPNDQILPEYERAAGLGSMAAGYYAIIDSARRRAAGVEIGLHRDNLAARYHQFSQLAVANPDGWDQAVVSAERIRNDRMLAFPYTKHHTSNWSVDQASALILCSVGEAERLAIPRAKWIFPHVFVEANHIVNITARADLHRCIGAEKAGRAILDNIGGAATDLDFIELYSCFPVASEIYAAALGLPATAEWSFTGSMPFAGGPFNSFVLHATAQLAHLLRRRSGSRGLVTTVSGVLTKQGMAVWGADPNPTGYTFVDVTKETARATAARDVDPSYEGWARIAGYTVLRSRTGAERGVAVVDCETGTRSIAFSEEETVLAAMKTDEFCDRTVKVRGGRFAMRTGA